VSLCPTPKKQRFATMEAAQAVADRASFALRKTLIPYDNCSCGWIHLSKERKTVQTEMLTGDGPWDDETFAVVTRADVMDQAAPADAARLREGATAIRWANALKTFQVDISAQLAARAGLRDPEVVAWRRRLGRVQGVLRQRRAEAKQLCIDHYANKPKDPEAELSKSASWRARERLVEAHMIEFMGYVVKEFEAVGLEPPRIKGSCPYGTCGEPQCLVCAEKEKES
jgi:hypothetical protein